MNPLTPEQIAELLTSSEPQPETPDTTETKQALESLGQTFRDPLQIGGVGPEIVSPPGGSFLIGSPGGELEQHTSDEGPQHRVTIWSFATGYTEVRFADYDRFAEATGSEEPDDEG